MGRSNALLQVKTTCGVDRSICRYRQPTKSIRNLGCQNRYEKSQIIEWAFNSYIGYNAIHIKDNTDYSKNLSVDELVEKVKGTSIDYNQPLTTDQLKKKGVEWLKRAYNNIVATHNLIDISNVKGEQLLFRDNQSQSVILTYSFPCQDLSLAGHRKGMTKGTQTRSGLLWEVERILIEREREIRVAITKFVDYGKCP